MSSPYEFLHNANLPSKEDIIAQCMGLPRPIGTRIHDPSTGVVIAWVKFGLGVTIHEACTQDWTAKTLSAAGVLDVHVPRVFDAFTIVYFGDTVGFIVMEYVEGVHCGIEDAELVAKAVERLIRLEAPPGATLGHIGGGPASIVHSFFMDMGTNADYHVDDDFYAHMRNIFAVLGIKFTGKLSSRSLYLCPSILKPQVFKKYTTPDGRQVVSILDFYATCFMPVPFVEVALRHAWHPFGRAVVRKIRYPHRRSKAAPYLMCASGMLVWYGSKAVALPKGVGPRRRAL